MKPDLIELYVATEKNVPTNVSKLLLKKDEMATKYVENGRIKGWTHER